MDIQTRKIKFIQEFLKIQNEELISHLEKLIRSNKSKDKDFTPMTIDELNIRIDKPVDDSKQNRLISSKDLVNEMETWN